jgi:DUF1680 family protein
MKYIYITLLTGCLFFFSCNGKKATFEQKSASVLEDLPGATVKGVNFQDVIITDNFWRPKIDVNRIISIRHALKEAEKSIEYFDIVAGKKEDKHTSNRASDSDVYKIIQGSAYALYNTPDKELEVEIDSIIDKIVAAQSPDGYINTYTMLNEPYNRWSNLERNHELYCAGHMFEAAVAYYQVTGKRKFLDAAIRFADHIDSIFGPDKRLAVPGHEEIELALYKLYQATGEKRYLDLCIFFVDERGDPKRMIVEKITPPDKDPNANTPYRWRPPSYMQDHLPVTQQFYAVGHAVRAGYLYSAMADIALETEDRKYLPAMDSIWNDIVRKKIYITGGVGTRQFHDEGFGAAYLLPNDQAYCETCSSIALNFWNRRMSLLHADSKYADLVELSMYNSVISGISLSGDKTFYTNPLESIGNRVRHDWSNPPCCPTNMVRFLPEIGSVIYGKTNKAIYINQFIGSETKIALADNEVALEQETDFPWSGKITLKINPESEAAFALHVRIPGWAKGDLLPGNLYHYQEDNGITETGVVLKINGETIQNPVLQNGYSVIDREWIKGDVVELELPMNIKLVAGNPRIEDTQGKVTLMRGPVVYCIEEIDNEHYFADPKNAYLNPETLATTRRDDLLNGVVTINGLATLSDNGQEIAITAIPYYAWNNRGPGKMRVWIPVRLD